ncbi:MAG: hypothetical protein ACOCVL_01235 [Candidatus Sumerlaeota bacterium]
MNYFLDNMEYLIRVLGHILGFGLPVMVLAVMFLVGIPLKLLVRSVVFYIVLLTGPALVFLWYLYNGILGLLGFDSVLALLLNLILFCSLGIFLAFFLHFLPQGKTRLRPYFANYFQKILPPDVMTRPLNVETGGNDARENNNE